ncbi:MAG: ADOP family duplicated permease [Gemmatimonadaceae bacterium]
MTIGELWRRLAHLVRGSKAADDLRAEMQLHAELRARANRAAGAAEGDARTAAHRQFGNEIALREQSRDQWGFRWAEDSARALRLAFRRLAQRPGFTAAVIGILALGVGAATSMFSAVDAAMLRPLPFADPARLVTLRAVAVPMDPGGAFPRSSGPVDVSVVDVREKRDLFSHAAAYAAGALNLADADHPSRLNVGVVTTDFFATLGVPAQSGRVFNDAEGVPNGPDVVVLSYGTWQRQFGGAPMIGKSILLNNEKFEVVGIMPRGFNFPSESDIWIPMSVPTTFATFSAFRGFLPSHVIARLAPGVSEAKATSWLMAEWERRAAAVKPAPGQPNYFDQMVRQIKADRPLATLQRDLAATRRTSLLVLLGATILLLLVTCANVTNLLLSQAAARRHEMAVRAVLGASRGRIVLQLLTESVVLALAGTVAGVAIAPAILGTVRALLPAQLSGVAPATIDVRVLAFAASLAFVTGVAFGLWPAIGSAGVSPAETIKSGGRSATGRGAGRGRRLLVGAEMAVTVVLLVGSLLMLRSFSRLMSLDRGMQTQHVGTLEMAFSGSAGGRAETLRKLDAMTARLAAIPGVAAAGVVNDLPLRTGGGIAVQVMVNGAIPPTAAKEMPRYLQASGGYFATMGIALKRGRTFTAADDSLAPPVALISESMARAYWPGVNPIGRAFTSAAPAPVTVVGVVADVREGSLESTALSQMYFPITEITPRYVALVARGSLDMDALLARMREAVRAVDPSQAIFDVRPMDEVVSSSVAPRRTNTLLISAFAAIALLLSAVGIYAVVSFSVIQRTREFGIRSALGATGAELITLVTGEMASVLAVGLVAGVAGAWALSRVLTSLIYGVTAHDPWSFAIAPVVMVVPALIAAVVPARRATKVNPAEVMRVD